MKMPGLTFLFRKEKRCRSESIDLNRTQESLDEQWLRELIRYLLEQARYERQAIMMDAIDKGQLEAFFGPLRDLDPDNVSLSEWEQVHQWNNLPRGGAEDRAKLMDDFAVYVVGMALGNRSDIRKEFVDEMFKAEKEEQERLFEKKVEEYRSHGQTHE